MKRQKKRKWSGRVLIGLPVAAGAAIIAAPYCLAGYLMSRKQPPKEAMKRQSERYDTSFYGEAEKEEYVAEGHDGYKLHAELLKNPAETDKYVILSHGHAANRHSVLRYVPMYFDLGFNCIIYDLRGHGENEEAITTYGILESKDLNHLIKDTRKRYPSLTLLGLHGESLGAATTITALKEKPEVDFVVADCAFEDIEGVIRTKCRKIHAPGFVADMAEFGAKMRYHYSLKDMRPIDSLDGNKIPILFIHGEDDNLILPQNSKDMYDRTDGAKELKLIPKARHAESIVQDPENYKRYVDEFVRKAVSDQAVSDQKGVNL